LSQISIIEFDLLTIVLSTYKLNRKWIVVPPINSVAFAMYATMQSFHSFFVFIKYSWIVLMIHVLIILATSPMYCNIFLIQLICLNVQIQTIITNLTCILILLIF
jgi:hypothetical protein